MAIVTVVYVVIFAVIVAMVWGAFSKRADEIRSQFMDQVKYFPSNFTLEDGESMEQSIYTPNQPEAKEEKRYKVDVATWMQNNKDLNAYYARTS